MKKVFLEALSASLGGKFWRFFFSSISTVIALLLVYKNLINPQANALVSVAYGVGAIVVLFIARFLNSFIRLCYKHYHFKNQEVVYGEAIILLKDSFGHINRLRKSNFEDKEFLRTTKVMCDNLKKLFDKKTKANCSISIKVPQSGTVRADDSVENLCRDTKHSATRDTQKYTEANHTIIGNTAYTKVLNSVQQRDENNFHYINNNISNTPDYQNTSRGLRSDDNNADDLPYKSELVYPIIPIQRKKDDDNDYRIWGFICVDCDAINGFDSKYDKAIIEGVADGVHDILMARYSFKTNQYGEH